MASLFSKIVAGEIPCYKVHESEDFLAFLDIMPLKEGHALVIPKRETDYIFDIADDELGRMMIFAKEVAVKIKKAFPCNRIGITVIGLEVPHAHIHLIPINQLDDMNFSKEKLQLSKEQLQKIASQIIG
ncbi:MAG: HIT family protein [Fluviicola sp.]|nr:HIT family protein [Fluviicola sp.]